MLNNYLIYFCKQHQIRVLFFSSLACSLPEDTRQKQMSKRERESERDEEKWKKSSTTTTATKGSH